MKKSLFILAAIIAGFSLTAFGYVKWNKKKEAPKALTCSKADVPAYDVVNKFYQVKTPDLVYKVESRFIATISRENLHNAKSIIDIAPAEGTQNLQDFKNVKLGLLLEGGETVMYGDSEQLSPTQLGLVQSMDYSDNFFIRADCQEKMEDGSLRYYNFVYYMSITPEKEAQYANGQEALIDYLKAGTKAETYVITEEKLKSGQVRFTVTKEGKIANVNLDYSSGYPNIDEILVKLISDMPGKWIPASNAKGDAVDQSLIFFFGKMGC